jgi:hypothetical protein
MKLKSTMDLYSAAAGGQAGGSSLINYPGSPADNANLPNVRDKARKRLVRPFASPDVDAGQSTNEKGQTDSAAFTGKKYIVQDTKYGHFTSEHDSSSSASLAEQARPYSRILRHVPPHNDQRVRNKSIKHIAKVNPDVL